MRRKEERRERNGYEAVFTSYAITILLLRSLPYKIYQQAFTKKHLGGIRVSVMRHACTQAHRLILITVYFTYLIRLSKLVSWHTLQCGDFLIRSQSGVSVHGFPLR